MDSVVGAGLRVLAIVTTTMAMRDGVVAARSCSLALVPAYLSRLPLGLPVL
jgi:hypothetical protein